MLVDSNLVRLRLIQALDDAIEVGVVFGIACREPRVGSDERSRDLGTRALEVA